MTEDVSQALELLKIAAEENLDFQRRAAAAKRLFRGVAACLAVMTPEEIVEVMAQAEEIRAGR